MADPAVRAIGVTKTYGSGEAAAYALHGIDVDFDSNCFTAIMGPSGSGKSTLLHCLAGLDTVTSGTVSIGRNNLSGMTDAELTRLRRSSLGFIFQSFNLLPTLTASGRGHERLRGRPTASGAAGRSARRPRGDHRRVPRHRARYRSVGLRGRPEISSVTAIREAPVVVAGQQARISTIDGDLRPNFVRGSLDGIGPDTLALLPERAAELARMSAPPFPSSSGERRCRWSSSRSSQVPPSLG